jgi:ribosomal protein S12 methylthiotransferase
MAANGVVVAASVDDSAMGVAATKTSGLEGNGDAVSLIPKRRLRSQKPWAYLQIADGCSRCCAFCTIPAIRGPYLSFPLREILVEAEELVSSGVRELILIAQDTGLWRDGESGLPELLETLAKRFPETWLRVMYLQPSGVSERLLAVMAKYSNICNYLDIPLQHASGRLIREMNRSGDASQYLQMLNQIRSFLPRVSLRTTVIAGYPSETRQEARELENFIEAAAFDYVGVFAYSPEDGTPAGESPDQVAKRTRLARAQRLRDLADQVSIEHSSRFIDQVQEVLVCSRESNESGDFWVGRTQGMAPEVDAEIHLACDPDWNSPDLIGEIVEARIIETFGYQWEGRISK